MSKTAVGYALVVETNDGPDITVHRTEAQARGDMLARFLSTWEMGELTNHTLTRNTASWRGLAVGEVTMRITKVILDESLTNNKEA